jgi:hypothetical protein
MAKGISIHVGVRKFKNAAYPGLPDTISCEQDALELGCIAAKMNFTPHIFVDDVSIASVKTAIITAAQVLEAGDYFLLTISTHGYPGTGAVPRGWCFSDGRVDRDEWVTSPDSVERWLRALKPGVRALIIANCCYGGSQDLELPPGALVLPAAIALHVARNDPRYLLKQKKDWKTWWSSIWKTTPVPKQPTFNFHLYEVAACAADKLALDGRVDTEMCPFSKQVRDLVVAGGYAGFAGFMTMLEANCVKASIPEPMLTPYDVQDTNFAATGPWCIV